MKASEVLQRYAEGRRDFRGENLRSFSFEGENLSGADFSEADIRGTNFSKANLTGAKFEEAKAGLPRRWVITLLFVCLVLLVFSSLLGLVFGGLVGYITSPKLEQVIVGWTSLVVFLYLDFLLIYRGIRAFLLASASAIASAFAIAFAFIFALGIAFAIARAIAIANTEVIGIATAMALFFVIGIASAIVFAIIFILVIASASAIGITSTIAFTIVLVVFNIFLAISFVFSIVNAIAYAIFFLFRIVSADNLRFAISNSITFSFAILSIVLYRYLGWRAIKGDPKDAWIRTMALAFAATGGTSFRGANLTDTDFTIATLKNTDFRDAILTRTCFKDAEKIDFARLGQTYLSIPKVQKLVVKGEGKNEDFNGLDCRGLNLAEANLENSSFIGCDLDKAKLQGANLSGAKLIRVQLNDVDLTGAILTGACIEDWSITNRTKIEKVECKYVYMKFINGDKRDQMPPTGEFREGEFVNFVKSILNTIDLYHGQNVDSQTVYAVIKSLATDYKEPLEIVGLEKRGDGAIVIKLKTSYYADQELLKEEYYQRYEQVFSLKMIDPENLLPDYEAIQEKLSKLIEEAKMNPTTYIKYIEGIVITGGNNQVTNQNHVGINNTGNITNSGAGAFNLGEITGTVANTINELPSSSEPDKPGLKELLTQLQSAIESDTHLSDKDKAKALKQVKALAEAGQNSKDEDKKDLADNAITMLKGIVTGLPVVATSVKACQELLPLITSIFGL